MSTDLILIELSENIIEGSTTDVDKIDSLGQSVTLFLHAVGFEEDYPATSGVLDVLNNGACDSSTHCGFRFRPEEDKETGLLNWTNGYTITTNESS